MDHVYLSTTRQDQHTDWSHTGRSCEASLTVLGRVCAIVKPVVPGPCVGTRVGLAGDTGALEAVLNQLHTGALDK
jgi:hypothetical protein